jgi:hypothetical protein
MYISVPIVRRRPWVRVLAGARRRGVPGHGTQPALRVVRVGLHLGPLPQRPGLRG